MKWLLVKLGELCEVITKGTTPRTLGKGYVSSGIPFLRAENLQGDEIILDKNTLFIDQETDHILSRSRIYPGDVLLSIAGTIGRAAIVSSKSPQMNCNQAVAIIRISGYIDRKFLLYWLKTNQAQSQIYGAQVTLTISNLSLGQIKNLQIALPPLSEQRRIVEILDQADALRRMRAEADAKAERILPALFIKMFGDPATNPMRWEEKKLPDLNIDFRYGTSVKCDSIIKGLPVLRIPNILGGEINIDALKYGELSSEETNRLLLQQGDLLFVRTNGNPDYVGRCAVFDLDEPYIFASYLIRARFPIDTVESRFIAAYLQTPSGRQGMLPFIRTTAGQSNTALS
ncbi:MAG: restriction endonuclease subunit S [Gloeotrichia echinulata DVL01]|jgi:type I restriction enzyme S subunit